MIAASDSLRERVARVVKAHAKDKGGAERPIYKWHDAPGPVTVRETEREGEATVEMALPEGSECLELWLPTGLFNILCEDKNADGPLMVVLPDGSVEAHICECKKTVDSTSWEKALGQMSWTLTKLRALAGALGGQITGAVFYTAFREDRLSEDESPNPSYADRLVGAPENGAEIRARLGPAETTRLDAGSNSTSRLRE